jgi:RND family efflux transporter MFP subunit
MMRFVRRHLWRIVALVGVFAVGAVVLFVKGRGGATARISNDAQVAVNYERLGEVVFPVEIDTVRRGTLTRFITTNGSVRAAQSVDIVARTSGFVELVPPPNGSHVSKGQTLVRFDSREAALALKEAEDKRLQAQVEFGLSMRETVGNSSSSSSATSSTDVVAEAAQNLTQNTAPAQNSAMPPRAAMLRSKSGLNAATNAVEKARLLLEFCSIQAPCSGVIANALVAKGQYVQAGQTLCKVLDVSALLVDVGVLETELPFVRVGTAAEATFQALPGVTLQGVVAAINPLADPTSKTYTVTIRLAGAAASARSLAPGMFATVRLAAEELRNRLLLPKSALLVRDKRNVVFSLGGTAGQPLAEWKYVQTGASNDQWVEITEGLEDGAVVLTEGHFTLAHGAAVKIVSAKKPITQ